jgi:carbon-monoxide dehydrogenase medium subunit
MPLGYLHRFTGVKPASFSYHRAATAGQAAALLAELGPRARILAGGQSLVPAMNMRLMTPAHLVDINPAAGELGYIRVEDGWLVVGAAARQSQAEGSPAVIGGAPLLAEAVGQVAHPPIRHRGTVVGSIAHAALVAELPCVAVTLDAEIGLLSTEGFRAIAAGDYFTGPFRTAARPDELVAWVRFPVIAAYTGHAWSELSPRRGNFPFAGAGASITLDGNLITAAAIGLCGVSDRPVRAAAAEAVLIGELATPEVIAAAAAAAGEGIEARPPLDAAAHILPVPVAPTADWDYRMTIARVQVRRALTVAADRARSAQ